jgi:hypothetical protein
MLAKELRPAGGLDLFAACDDDERPEPGFDPPLKDERMTEQFGRCERRVLLRQLETPRSVRELMSYFGKLRGKNRQQLEEHIKLSYYFGGLEVAYERTEQGPEIIASGPPEEVARVLDSLDPEHLNHITIDFPERFERILSGLRPENGDLKK